MDNNSNRTHSQDYSHELFIREVDLFWKKNIVFSLIIAALLIGYTNSSALIYSSFGFLCAFIWTMINRRFRIDQDNLQTNPDSKSSPCENNPTIRKFMYSRIAEMNMITLLSDCTVLFWFLIVLYDVTRLMFPTVVWNPITFLFFSIIVFISAIIYVLRSCKFHRNT